MKERRDEPAPRLKVSPDDRAPTSERPIFIIGAQRSGTSLVRRILDSHSRIACPPESKFILPISRALHERKAMAGFDSLGFDREETQRAFGHFLRGFFDAYAVAQNKPRWAEKTPNYVDCLPEIWDLFGPDVQFVIIVRHGLDTAFSLADPHRHYPALDEFMDEAKGDKPVAAGLFWADKNSKIEAFRKAQPEACYSVRYENITQLPHESLPPLFEFLGEPWEPDVIDYSRFPHHEGYGDPDVKRRKTVEPNSGKHRSWPPEVQDAVRRACGPLLGELGYR